MIDIGIIGANGYLGIELIRIIIIRRRIELIMIIILMIIV